MRKGAQTLVFESKPVILSHAAIGGKKEGEGPLAAYFDFLGKDAKLSQKTFEKAESKLQELALDTAKRKLGVSYEDIDVLFAGDLLNQCISSSFAARGTSIPFLGLYGACSTMAESLLLAAAFVDAGFARTDLLALCLGGAAVPLPAWLRRAADADGAVDRDGLRLLHRGRQRQRCAHRGGDDRPRAGSRHQGREQHGRSHGPGGYRYAAGAFPRSAARAAGL